MAEGIMAGLTPIQVTGTRTPGTYPPLTMQNMQNIGMNVPNTWNSYMGRDNQGPMSAFGQFWNDNGQGIMQGLGAFTGLANLYSGFKQLGLQEDAFDFQKDAWTKNYNNQVKDYENRLRDRWAARNNSMAARGKEYQSLESYLGDRQLTGEAAGG